MRVGRYLVTTIDYVGPEGVERRLTIQPSESLPEERRVKIQEGRLEEFIRLIRRTEDESE
jgi:hypothetical protein